LNIKIKKEEDLDYKKLRNKGGISNEANKDPPEEIRRKTTTIYSNSKRKIQFKELYYN
jgi:hypothetical protein